MAARSVEILETRPAAAAQTAPPEAPARKPVVARLVMGVLVSWALLDVAGRVAPLHWLHVIPEFEASQRPGRFSPFTPNLSINYRNWVGEAAITANVAPTQTRPPIRFSTDDLGYRLTPGLDRDGDIDLIFYEGASFVYGGGLSDDETLPAALTRKGLRSYNAAHPWWIPTTTDSLDRLVERLRRGRRSVLAVCWEDSDFTPRKAGPEPWADSSLGQAARARLREIRNYTTALLRISPLEVLSIRAFKVLSDDVVLPNRYRTAAESHPTPDGGRILFTTTEVDRATHPPSDSDVARNASYFRQLAVHAAGLHLDLYVILLPNRYSVYGPLVDRTRRNPPSDYLERLERELMRRDIPVLNTAPLMRAHAAGDLASGRLAYYREDHHWTALGVERVAEAFRAFLAARGASAHAVQ